MISWSTNLIITIKTQPKFSTTLPPSSVVQKCLKKLLNFGCFNCNNKICRPRQHWIFFLFFSYIYPTIVTNSSLFISLTMKVGYLVCYMLIWLHVWFLAYLSVIICLTFYILHRIAMSKNKCECPTLHNKGKSLLKVVTSVELVTVTYLTPKRWRCEGRRVVWDSSYAHARLTQSLTLMAYATKIVRLWKQRRDWRGCDETQTHWTLVTIAATVDNDYTAFVASVGRHTPVT